MCSPTVKAFAFRAALCCAADSPVWIRTLLKLAPKRGSIKLRTAPGNGEPPGMLTRVDNGTAGAGLASARRAAPLAPFCTVEAGAGASRMRATFFAVSSASNSAGSPGFEIGRRLVLENWMDGSCAVLTMGRVAALSLAEATDREISSCVARLPRRSCRVLPGDLAFADALRWTV